jgi:hypothetical protein
MAMVLHKKGQGFTKNQRREGNPLQASKGILINQINRHVPASMGQTA